MNFTSSPLTVVKFALGSAFYYIGQLYYISSSGRNQKEKEKNPTILTNLKILEFKFFLGALFFS